MRKKFLFILFLLWICLSMFNVVYNAGKSISEVKEWGPLSDREKREKIFGDLYNFFIFIQEHTNNTDIILIYSEDSKSFYLSKYYLYPRIVNSSDDMKEILEQAKDKKYNFIASYGRSLQLKDYLLVASDFSKQSYEFYLYRKR